LSTSPVLPGLVETAGHASTGTTRPAGATSTLSTDLPVRTATNGESNHRQGHETSTRTQWTPRSTPERLHDYACKITGGRLVKISLPTEFSRADASRVYAFLLTQIDDDSSPDQDSTPPRRS